jgi:hypothetical protein
MDPGQVVWLPGSGWGEFEESSACMSTYGPDAYACGDVNPYEGGTLVYCCFY